MAIGVSDRAVAEIKKAAGQRATLPKGLRVGIRGGGCTGFSYLFEWSDAEPRPEDKVLSFEDGAVRVFVDPKSFLYLDGSTLEYPDVDDGARIQVHEPQREGDLRLRRERAVLAPRSRERSGFVICWSCEKGSGGTGPLCAACESVCRRPDDAADLRSPCSGCRASSRSTSAAAEAAYKDLSRQVHPDRFATADPRARRASLGAHGAAQRGVAHREGSGAARRVPARSCAGFDLASDDKKAARRMTSATRARWWRRRVPDRDPGAARRAGRGAAGGRRGQGRVHGRGDARARAADR